MRIKLRSFGNVLGKLHMQRLIILGFKVMEISVVSLKPPEGQQGKLNNLKLRLCRNVLWLSYAT